jgi:hypothetical protein
MITGERYSGQMIELTFMPHSRRHLAGHADRGSGGKWGRRNLDYDDPDAVGLLDPHLTQFLHSVAGSPTTGYSSHGQPGVLLAGVICQDPGPGHSHDPGTTLRLLCQFWGVAGSAKLRGTWSVAACGRSRLRLARH